MMGAEVWQYMLTRTVYSYFAGLERAAERRNKCLSWSEDYGKKWRVRPLLFFFCSETSIYWRINKKRNTPLDVEPG
jgi:hypothetical protein